jgi:hypothetical protein
VQAGVFFLEHLLQAGVAHQFPDRHHDGLAVLALVFPQGAQDFADFAPAQPVQAVEIELPVGVVLVEQQDAIGGAPVAAGATGLLQIISTDPGMSPWITTRTSSLSTPMPKALVAAMTCKSPALNRSWTSFFSSGGRPAW